MNHDDNDVSSSGQHDLATPEGAASLDDTADASGERLLARRSLLIGGLVAVAAPIGVAAFVGRRSKLGGAPEFTLEDLANEGARVSLADRAAGPALVNFWASWCVPCRTEMPILEAAFVRFGSRILFIGVDHQDSRTAAQDFIANAGVQYRSGFDPDGAVAAAYGIRGLPTTVLVSADGRLVETITGALTAARLERLLGDGLGIK